jgi:hypothetical protein
MPNIKNVTSPSDRINLSNAVLYLYNGTALTSPPVYNALPATWPAELSNDEQMANLLAFRILALLRNYVLGHTRN